MSEVYSDDVISLADRRALKDADALCEEEGHDLVPFINASNEPVNLACGRCGRTWKVLL